MPKSTKTMKGGHYYDHYLKIIDKTWKERMDHNQIMQMVEEFPKKEWHDIYNHLLLSSCTQGVKKKELVSLCLLKGADINCSYDFVYMSNTPLLNATNRPKLLSLEFIKFLVDNGADVNAKNMLDICPLIDILYQAYPDFDVVFPIVKLLVENGADVNITHTEFNYTPLHRVCENAENRALKIVKYLVENGADVNKQTTPYGWTPLYFAARNGNYAIFKYLVDHGADIHTLSSSSLEKLVDAAKEGKNGKIIRYFSGQSLYNTLDVGNAQINSNTEFIDKNVMTMDKEKQKQHGFFYNVKNVDPKTNKVKRVYQKELLQTLDDMDTNTANPFTREPWLITEDYKIKKTLKKVPNSNLANSLKSNALAQQTQNNSQKTSSSQRGGRKSNKYTTYKGEKYMIQQGLKGGLYILVEGKKIYKSVQNK
jgi:ankyrin repeat protein